MLFLCINTNYWTDLNLFHNPMYYYYICYGHISSWSWSSVMYIYVCNNLHIAHILFLFVIRCLVRCAFDCSLCLQRKVVGASSVKRILLDLVNFFDCISKKQDKNSNIPRYINLGSILKNCLKYRSGKRFS